MNTNNFVEPKIIASPYTQSPVRPRIAEFHDGDQIIKEAQWYCHDTGRFIQKGIVSITSKKKPEDNQE